MTTSNLPKIQKDFVNGFDNTIEYVLSFEGLESILNPVFSGHYFVESVGEFDPETGETPIVTTKHTDGSSFCVNSEEERNNSYKLAEEVKAFIMSFNPVRAENILSIEDMKKYGKVDRIKNRAAIMLNGEIKLIKGLNL